MKSTNSAIQELHSFIIKNENNDSDAWNIGGYDDDLIKILEDYFTDFDWQELKLDLENWNTNQLEIFAHCIVNGNGNQDDPDDYKLSIDKRINLLPKLLSISISRENNEIGNALSINSEILNLGNPIAINTISQIAHYFDFSNEINNQNIENKSIMENIQIAFNRASR